MKIVFIHDHVFVKDTNDNKVYSPGKLPYDAFKRYITIFGDIEVIGRVRYVKNNKNLMLSSGPNINFTFVDSLSSLKAQFFKKGKVKKQMSQVISKADGIIARLPSELGFLAIKIAKELNKPFAVEVVGDPWDALWNFGNFKGKLYAPVVTLKTKKYVQDAPFCLYVTNKYLQEKYPNKGYNVGCSNVEIKELRKDLLSDASFELNDKVFKIGLIGSLNAAYKGIDKALEAIALIKEKYPQYNFKLEVVGEGDSNQWLSIAQRLGVQNNVDFLGVFRQKHDLFKWLDGVDLYIQPSLTEGLPRALVEAMSRGKPCLGSSVGGIPELLEEDCLHSPKNTVDFSKNIERALNDKEWRKRQAIRNLEVADTFLLEKLNKIRLDFWNEYKKMILKETEK